MSEPESSPKGSRYLSPSDADSDAVDPSPPPERPSLKPLGSLAQSARLKQLNSARAILFFIGITTLAFNVFLYLHAPKEVDDVIQAEVQKAGPGMVFDPVKLEEAKSSILLTVRLIYGGTAALGVLFIIFGIIIKRFPVPVTVLGLVLYLGSNAVFAYLNPETLRMGIVLKIIFIVALFKAIQAAMEYQKEVRAAQAGEALA